MKSLSRELLTVRRCGEETAASEQKTPTVPRASLSSMMTLQMTCSTTLNTERLHGQRS